MKQYQREKYLKTSFSKLNFYKSEIILEDKNSLRDSFNIHFWPNLDIDLNYACNNIS